MSHTKAMMQRSAKVQRMDGVMTASHCFNTLSPGEITCQCVLKKHILVANV
jgi:hypothetical protein